MKHKCNNRRCGCENDNCHEAMKVTLKKAIDVFGTDMQLNVAVEEFSELTKEICKYKRGIGNIPNIIEEIADCYIVLEQIKIMFWLDNMLIVDEMNKKVERLKFMLENYPTSKDSE